MNRKKKLTLLAVLCLSLFLLAGCGNSGTAADDSNSNGGEQPSDSEQTDDADLLAGLHHVTIEVQDYGTISVELDADAAPVTVTNFVKLASEGFYDGLTFHRIVSGFMIQGGDPNGDGTGGSGESIQGEFAANGVENSLSHTRGAISMARMGNNYDSATSQFFIVHEDSTYLDGQYAAFGYVTEGMEIVDQICEQVPVADMQTGLVAAEKQPVIAKVTVVD